MPCRNEYLEKPIMLDLSALSEIAGEDWEGKQVEKDLVGRLAEFEKAVCAKGVLDAPVEGAGFRL